jgi:hypothetical protein
VNATEQQARWLEAAAAMPPAVKRPKVSPVPDWSAAKCIEEDMAVFYPVGNLNPSAVMPAKLICSGCPLTGLEGPCLAAITVLEGNADNKREGIFAGLTPAERKQLAGPKLRQPCGTRAAAAWHQTHGEPVCEKCRLATNAYRATLPSTVRAA